LEIKAEGSATSRVICVLSLRYQFGSSITFIRYDKARVLGQQNNDPNAAIYKANYERTNAKLKEAQTKKQ
jgi:hypothetical protein